MRITLNSRTIISVNMKYVYHCTNGNEWFSALSHFESGDEKQYEKTRNK